MPPEWEAFAAEFKRRAKFWRDQVKVSRTEDGEVAARQAAHANQRMADHCEDMAERNRDRKWTKVARKLLPKGRE